MSVYLVALSGSSRTWYYQQRPQLSKGMMTRPLVPENAFFTREVRQFARRRPFAWRLAAACLGFMALVVAAWAPLARGRSMEESSVLWLLLGPHIVLCAAAASYGMSRVFWAEDQIGALETAMLLPLSEWQWLCGKLAFPVALTAFAWLCGWPLYVLAMAAGVIAPQTLFDAPLVPLLAGLAVVPAVLINTPDLLKRSRRSSEAPGEQGLEIQIGASRSLLAFAFGAWVLSLCLRGFASLSRDIGFFGFIVPEGAPGAVVITAFLVATATTAHATVNGHERSEQRARIVRRVAVLIVYTAVLGVLWMYLREWQQWLGVLLPFVVGALQWAAAIERRRQTRRAIHPNAAEEREMARDEAVAGAAQRREDSRSAAEIAWFETHHDNAVLVKDLRVHLRAASLRTLMAWELLVVAGLTIAFYVVEHISPGFLSKFGSGAWYVLSSFATAAGAFATAMWQKEAKGCTLLLLLLSPLPSPEILRGRLLGGLIRGWLAQWPLIIGVVVVWAFVLHQRGNLSAIGPSLVALCPALLACNICMGSNARSGIPNDNLPPDYSSSVGHGALLIALCVACVAVLMMGMIGKISLVALWLWAGLLCIGGAALCLAWFRLRVRQMDALRRGDMPLEALRSHALAEAQPSQWQRLWK